MTLTKFDIDVPYAMAIYTEIVKKTHSVKEKLTAKNRLQKINVLNIENTLFEELSG